MQNSLKSPAVGGGTFEWGPLMRRFIVLLLPAVVLSLGSGCRSSCGERTGLLGRKSDSTPGQLAKATHQPTCDTCSTAGNYVPPGGVTYPVGPPTTFGPGAIQPSNELPFPMIPAPGVPEGPSAQPIPAIPAKNHTASDPKLLK